MKKIIAVLLIALLVFAGCASAPVKDQAENKEEKKLVINQGERDIGALLVITGIALGTWWGNTWASNDNQIWTSIAGGLAGGAMVMLPYWGFLELTGDKEKEDKDQPEEKTDVLMPEE